MSKNKEPAFLFYPNDWLGGTMYLTFEQKGAYLELLLLQVSVGKFTDTQVKQVLNTSYTSVWTQIKEKFSTDGTYYWNVKLQSVLEKRQAFTLSRRSNRLGKTQVDTQVELVKHTSNTLVKLVGNVNVLVLHPLQIHINTLPFVSKMDVQPTPEECDKLISKYGDANVKEVLFAMDNHKQLLKKYRSVYGTLNNWLKRRGGTTMGEANHEGRAGMYTGSNPRFIGMTNSQVQDITFKLSGF